jgi:hypothetical protein
MNLKGIGSNRQPAEGAVDNQEDDDKPKEGTFGRKKKLAIIFQDSSLHPHQN